jgi:hypothetical protein
MEAFRWRGRFKGWFWCWWRWWIGFFCHAGSPCPIGSFLFKTFAPVSETDRLVEEKKCVWFDYVPVCGCSGGVDSATKAGAVGSAGTFLDAATNMRMHPTSAIQNPSVKYVT